jgi:hypothetical protein
LKKGTVGLGGRGRKDDRHRIWLGLTWGECVDGG